MKGNSEIKLDKCHIIYQKHNASTWHGQFMINLFSLRLGKLKMSLYHNCEVCSTSPFLVRNKN